MYNLWLNKNPVFLPLSPFVSSTSPQPPTIRRRADPALARPLPPLFLRTLAPMTLAAEHCIVPACLASCIHVNGRGGCSRMVGKGVIAVDGGDGGVSKFVAVGG